MILQSLVDYYEILAAAGKISRPGYCRANVSYALNLAEDGELLGVIPLKVSVPRGKKMVETPQSLEVPEQMKRSGSSAPPYFLCDNSQYALGLEKGSVTKKSLRCFKLFSEYHIKMLTNLADKEAFALLRFLEQWNPEKALENSSIKEHIKEISSGGNFVFQLNGMPKYVHENKKIIKDWEEKHNDKQSQIHGQCLITGEYGPIARIHNSVKGIVCNSLSPNGWTLVGVDKGSPAFSSYEKTQGYNSPISEYAAFAYATALNHLLSDREHKQSYGDTTIVYWAKSPERIYNDIFNFGLNPLQNGEETAMEADENSEGLIQAIFQKLVKGQPVGDFGDAFDKDTRFYILGLAPNAARLSVRFFMENSFGNILRHVAQHYRDLEIERAPKDFEYLPLWKLMSETVSPMSKDKASSPLLSGSVLRSILSGAPYPEALYNSVIVRIRAEGEISRGKAAIIKACLIRNKYDRYKEELTVSLNDNSKNRAYVLGRLFAALEKAQIDAGPGINATIKDRYFTSACATPAGVFPILLRLANHHMAKSDYGYISERRISDLMDKLEVEKDPFPAHLTLDEQGIFILGYYHQEKANYAKKDKEEK